ncbi:hypothetical protein D3C75_1090710 [compost metagenome]
MRPKFASEVAGKTNDCGFGGAVMGRDDRQVSAAGDGGHVHNPPEAALDHPRNKSPR